MPALSPFEASASKDDYCSIDCGKSPNVSGANCSGALHCNCIRDDIKDIENDFQAIGFGQLLKMENEG